MRSRDLVTQALEAADRNDDTLGVFIDRYDETALADADDRDRELHNGTDRGPLHGIPIGVKDVISTEEGPTTAQSRALEPEWGSFGDAEAVRRLREAGAIIIGKVTTMEFAGGMIADDNPYPIPKNPWDTRRWPGGSSSGSAVGVAADMMLGALGTDTGGSVRCPAGFCGITGLKATYDAVPKSGVTPMGFSFDTVGPMARSAWDCAALYEVLSGQPVLEGLTRRDFTGVTIGLDRSMLRQRSDADPAVEPALDDVADVLETLGARVVEVTVPFVAELADAAFLQSAAEGYSWHRNRLRAHWDEYGADLKSTLMKGLMTAGDMVQLDRVRAIAGREIAKLFEGIDGLLFPTAHRGAPLLDQMADLDGLPRFTAAWNAVGYPALTVPIGFSAEGLPLGAQFIAPAGRDDFVLALGHAFQQHSAWHLATPGDRSTGVPSQP